jgi:predicted AAA+ superfamily ATPase
MYIPRHLEEPIRAASRAYPVVMLCGQRQVGKSTLLRHIAAPGRRAVTLDDLSALRLAQNDPALFFETYGTPLLIDEFQRAPQLLLEIKRRVDEKILAGLPCAGDYWLTGSQKFVMMKNASESLAGRVAVFELSGLSAAEIDERPARVFSPEVGDLRERVAAARLEQAFEERDESARTVRVAAVRVHLAVVLPERAEPAERRVGGELRAVRM